MADLADRLLQDEDSKDDLTTEARIAEIAAALDAAREQGERRAPALAVADYERWRRMVDLLAMDQGMREQGEREERGDG